MSNQPAYSKELPTSKYTGAFSRKTETEKQTAKLSASTGWVFRGEGSQGSRGAAASSNLGSSRNIMHYTKGHLSIILSRKREVGCDIHAS